MDVEPAASAARWRVLRVSVFPFIILSLAVYRLTVLISRDGGPFNVFMELRKIDSLSVLRCPYCSSIWISAFVNVGYYYSCEQSPIPVLLGLIFAMSAITIILDRCFSADYLVK